MSLSTQRIVAVGFLLALAVLAASSYLSYRGLRRMEDATEAARRSSEMLIAVGDLEQTITDAETGQRGFLLTGDPRYLAPYSLAMQQLRHVAATISAKAQPDQAPLVQRSIALMSRRAAIMTTTIDAWTRGDREAAVAILRAGHGKAMMDSLRTNISTIRAAGLSRFDDQQQEAHAQVVELGLIIALGMLLALAVAGAATAMVARDERSREEARRALERARDAAEEGSRAKSDFLARMSHELRTPLNAVIGFAGVMLRNKRGALDDQDISFLRRIQANGNTLLTIINDILDLSKVESGRMDVMMTRVDLMALVRTTAESFVPSLVGREVTLALDSPAMLKPLTTDIDRLRQVITNLIANAIKFTPHGRVMLRVVQDQHADSPWRLDVVDSGIGVAASRQEAIFGAFEQAENSISRRFGGTGLGLSISRSICERLGYRLAVVSEEGVGSTFSILFDRAALPPERHEQPTGGEIVGRGLHTSDFPVQRPKLAADERTALVLIIDDDADSRLLLSQYMDDFGLQSIAAMGGEQGLQMALEFKPDIILVDLQMPGMDGWQVIQRLKSHRATGETPIVVVSIVSADQWPRSLDVTDVITKPVSREALYATVRRHLIAAAAVTALDAEVR